MLSLASQSSALQRKSSHDQIAFKLASSRLIMELFPLHVPPDAHHYS